MKKLLLRILIALAVAVPGFAVVLPTVAPTSAPVVAPATASAGWNTWETNPCRPDIWWLANEQGVWYYHLDTGAGPFLVQNGSFLSAYAARGYQCGWLGAPTSGLVYVNNHEIRQYFEGGYLLDWWY